MKTVLHVKKIVVTGGIVVNRKATAMYFESEQDGSTIGMVGFMKQDKVECPMFANLEISSDNSEWSSWDGSSVTLNQGEQLYVRGNNPDGLVQVDADGTVVKYNKFVMSGKIGCHDSIQSLLSEDGSIASVPAYGFGWLFTGCSSLTSAPELPSTQLSNYCYYNMFELCTSLTQAPVLPATELAEFCYGAMFCDCSSLVEAPILPALTMANACYLAMFKRCTSLTTPPELPATTLANFCYDSMFDGSGVQSVPSLPAMELKKGCYEDMFTRCNGLTSSGTLNATSLAQNCYLRMFQDSINMESAQTTLPATTLVDGCYQSMFQGCTSLRNSPSLPSTALVDNCYRNMFYNCSSLERMPTLNGTSLGVRSYSGMFYGCSSMVTSGSTIYLDIRELPDRCYESMFYGCTNITQTIDIKASSVGTYSFINMIRGTDIYVDLHISGYVFQTSDFGTATDRKRVSIMS